MATIEKKFKKIKHFSESEWGRILMWIIILFCFGLSSFFLGGMYERSQIRDEYTTEMTYSEEAIDLWNKYQVTKFSNTRFFASKNGSVVYPVGCSLGNRIKEENKVFFETLLQAQDAGYKPAEGC